MSYSDKKYVTYSYGSIDFGSGDEQTSFKLPEGKQGSIVDVEVNATETFTDDTTEGFVKIGSTAGGAQYANCGLGTLADTDTYRATDNAGDIVDDNLPADTQIEVEFTAPTGGTPAGMGDVHIHVAIW